MRVLFHGFGNPGRRDDGLGPACAAALERLQIPGLVVDADYQLTVDDSVALRDFDVVVFADAALRGPEPFEFRALEPKPGVPFGSHGIEPPALLALTRELFGRAPEAWVLAIRGYDFEGFEERLSGRAAANLAAALRFIAPVLRNRAFRTAGQDSHRPDQDPAAAGEGVP
ncbi:MAG: hydrogenase maturation protease [Deltaproteobacteria bacterium]|nr:hydrogenase maturation protease [Deltaproteobacteria bacterium]